MSDPMPNCVIDVHFDEVEARFSYVCAESSRGWQVDPDGSIFPPIRSRVVQFRLKGDPATKIAGLQIAEERPGLPPSNRWHTLPDGVTPISPTPFPPADNEATFTELTFNFGDEPWFYRLAVVVGTSEPIWDDPKIHDDGTE